MSNGLRRERWIDYIAKFPCLTRKYVRNDQRPLRAPSFREDILSLGDKTSFKMSRQIMCVGGLKAKYQRDISSEKGRPLLGTGRKFRVAGGKSIVRRDAILIKRAPTVCRRPSSEIEARKHDLRE